MKIPRILALILLSLVLLTGCSQEVFPESAKYNGEDVQQVTNSYRLLNGRKFIKIQASEGQTLQLHYILTVRSGELGITLESPDGKSLWNLNTIFTMAGEDDFQIQQSGTYVLRVNAKETTGGYDLRWKFVE